MLDLVNQKDAFDLAWRDVDRCVELTNEIRAEHAKQGPLPTVPDERRSHPRFYFWRRAILTHGERRFASFTKNVSKSGVLVLVPEQLFPCERASVVLETGQTFNVIVRRCRRVAERCYEVGAEFVARKS